AVVALRWRPGWFGIIKDVCVVVRKVPTMDVVDKSISVVIDVVVWNLTRVGPNVVAQIVVVDIDSRVDNSDDNAAVACSGVPGLLHANVVVGGSGIPGESRWLTGVVESPQFRVSRIVWSDQRSADEVRLGVDDVGPGAQCFDGVAGIGGIDSRDTQDFDHLPGRAHSFKRQRDLSPGSLSYYLTAQLLRL